MKKRLGCAFDKLNQSAVGVRVFGSLNPHLNIPLWFGLLSKTDCRPWIGFYLGVVQRIAFVCCARKRRKHASICSLAVNTQARYGEKWLEAF